MIKLNIKNEFSPLRAVIIGIANDFGGTPTLDACYDPKSKENVALGVFPSERDCIDSINSLVEIIEKYNIQIYRPKNIIGLNQIFSRDIAFVIEDKIVLPNIIEDRKGELAAINQVLDQIDNKFILKMPFGTRAEGGDVIMCDKYIFVGYSESEDFKRFKVSRTNRSALDFLSNAFPHKIVKGFQLIKSDDDSTNNALHLDCCFQPIGKGMAILYEGGFKCKSDFQFLIDYFGEENIITLSNDEMCKMYTNVFSISENVIVSDKHFYRLNSELRRRGFVVEEVLYSEIGKMSGLFRCSTMPLIRE